MLFRRKKEEVRDIIKEIYGKDKLVRYAEFIFGVFVVAVAFNLFVLPSNIVYGVSGSPYTDELYEKVIMTS